MNIFSLSASVTKSWATCLRLLKRSLISFVWQPDILVFGGKPFVKADASRAVVEMGEFSGIFANQRLDIVGWQSCSSERWEEDLLFILWRWFQLDMGSCWMTWQYGDVGMWGWWRQFCRWYKTIIISNRYNNNDNLSVSHHHHHTDYGTYVSLSPSHWLWYISSSSLSPSSSSSSITCESSPVAGIQAHKHKKFCSQMSENLWWGWW